MTRETKIGLLVGLAFIIVIGILLSDHMTSTTDPPKAPLSVAGGNVRESVTTPAAPGASGAIVGGAGAPAVVAPTQSVLTGADLTNSQRPPVQIQVGPGAPQQAQSPVVVQQGPAAQPPVQVAPAPSPTAQRIVGESPVVIAPPQPQSQSPLSHPLQQLASRHGEEIVPVGSASGNAAKPQPVPMAPVREYKAQTGDSLSKIASRFMGSASKANQEAIVRLNPSLIQNPNKIVEGRTYVLPPAPAAADGAAAANPVPAAPAPTPAAPSTDTAAARRTEPAAAAAGDAFTWYTVKDNENLWKIAAEQLGSGNAWTQIRDLNPDVLKGEDKLRVNMRIRIPNKPVASAAH